MVRLKYACRKDIKTQKIWKIKNLGFLKNMLTYNGVSKEYHVVFKTCVAFFKVFKYVSMCAKFQVNSIVLSEKKYCKGNFKPTPH